MIMSNAAFETEVPSLKDFKDIVYERPDMEALKQQFAGLLANMRNAATFGQFDEALQAVNQLRNQFETAMTLVSIRHTVDTNDAFYEAEQDYFDQNEPEYQDLVTSFYKALTESNFEQQVIDKYGKLLLLKASWDLKTFKPAIIPDLQKENELSSSYTKLISSAKVPFEGEVLNLSGFTPYEESLNRDIRKKAMEAKFGFLASHQQQLDDIYGQLVTTRHGIAQKLGFNNFVELAYVRRQRTDYNAQMVANYRQQIATHLVPLANKLHQQQAKRLGITDMKFYDDSLLFTTGNPKPHGKSDWMVNQGKRMYKELAPETDEFFSFMVKHGLLDLDTRPGKAPGGYCTFIGKYKAPFIFSNFNGTSGDVDVLTHEAGHAFQVYMSRNFEVPEYNWPTMEACEIHSMSMEFFTWPWMNLFFEQEAAKYQYGHLVHALLFLPYGASVDEFQHFVFENPTATPDERAAAWKAIEQKYLPHRNYDGNAYLESGRFWQKQAHIYNSPFYYIDYTLAQICALQFWKRSTEEPQAAWQDYLNLCKAGGSRSFLDLVKLAGLDSPFEDGTVERVVKHAAQWLDNIDDTKL